MTGEPLSGIEAVSEYLEETREDRPSLIPGEPCGAPKCAASTGWFDTKFYAEVSEPVLTEKVDPPLPAARGGRRFARHEPGALGPHASQGASRLYRRA